MSVSEQEYGLLRERDFDTDYEDFVEERVRVNGPVSLSDLKEELENEKRYDSFTDPEDVELDDTKELEEAFYALRERNRDGGLDGEIAASFADSELHLRVMDETELLRYRLDTGPYRIEE